uniref:DDE Tnp4 domain-containing protein n=1 Tax=Moniliophthora roreri TaxID=221103 RepID=A0A0W0F6S5_MONRR
MQHSLNSISWSLIHLAEWGRVQQRPQSKEELFNLRHAQARNVIEHIFGVIKWQWRILVLPPEFSMKIQAQIPAALAALHNFILEHNDNFLQELWADKDAVDPAPGHHIDAEGPRECHPHGELASHHVSEEEYEEALHKQDNIAQAIWEQYQEVLQA